MDENLGTIIIDNGSYMTKAGFAGHEAPRAIFPSIIGRPKHVASIAGKQNKDSYVGDEAEAKSGILNLKNPIERGIITNWEDIETIWHHTFYEELRVNPAEYTIILTEVPFNPKNNREKATQIMFETFNVPSFFLEIQANLSIYSTGRVQGIVFESGAEASNIVPIEKGHSISKGINTFNLAGSEVLEYCPHLFHKIMTPTKTMTNRAFSQIFRDFKEKCGYVALDYDAELKKAKTTSECQMDFTFPDGNTITTNEQRFSLTELLFNPHLNGYEFGGVHEFIFDSINKCDESIRKDLYNNIVLAGGNTLFEGLPERIEKEIKKLAPPETKVTVIAPPERKYAAWIGGSILASLATFPQMTISRNEYNESGPGIVHTKCSQS
ncbi:hypothetical protein M9Y10_021793 [Tritrichomonas musculus]|uniref:Actin n=1 Tax=Tritrichomonas musculus TaxID=1915356 RepID=A0ABR2KRI9_9EUKA